jgi:FixJ family two-component response regulator
MSEKLVLVIDDDATVSNAVKLLLNAYGIRSDVLMFLRAEDPFEGGMIHGYRHDGSEAVLDPILYAVALLDGDLPDGPQGYDIVRELRASTEIICVGISGNMESARKQKEAGAHEVQMKPIPPRWLGENLPRLFKMHRDAVAGSA